MERRPAHRRITERKPVAVSTRDLTQELKELIVALDQRLPRVEQAGEEAIARDAAALRAKAIDRLRELTEEPSQQPV